MNQIPDSPVHSASWPARHKRIVIIAASVAVLVLAVTIGALLFIRSGRLNRYIIGQVEGALAEYGLRAEIDGLDIAWGVRTAKAYGIKVYNEKTGQLIATADHAEVVVEIPNPYALRLRREVVFRRIDLVNLHIYLELDENGQSNFTGLHPAPPSAPSSITFDFSNLVGSITDGSLHLLDKAHKIEAELANLQATGQPVPKDTQVSIHLSAGPGPIRYEQRETNFDTLDIAVRAGESNAEIDHITLHSPLGEVSVNGRVDDVNALRYDFGVRANVALGEVSRVFAPDIGLGGNAAFEGRVQGEASLYHITGGLRSDELAVAGTRVRGAAVDNIHIDSGGERITFASNHVKASAVVAREAQLTGVSTSAVRGEMKDGETRANIQQVTVARVAVSGAQVSGVALRDITATLKNGRVQATMREASAPHVQMANDHVDGIAIGNIKASVQGGRYQVDGDLGIAGGSISDAPLGPARGQLSVSNNAVGLTKFNASVFGGTANGDAVIAMGRGGASRLTASLAAIQTNDVLKVADVSGAPIAGTLDGQVNVTWPGTDFKAMSGAINAHLSGQTTQTSATIPVNGDVGINALRGAFTVGKLELATNASALTATGTLTIDGESDLDFSLTSRSAEELQTIAYAVDDVEKRLADYKPSLAGGFKLQGRVKGSLKDPTIESDLSASSIGLHDQELGSLTGHVLFSPTTVAFEKGNLAVTGGGSAKFTYSAPRESIATDGHLDATIDSINIETLTTAAGLPSQQKVITGAISGEAHLTGLPGSPVGTATAKMVNGTVFDQPAQVATAKVVFDGQTAKIEQAELRTAQGQLTATGEFDMKSDSFQLQARADNVDLGRLAASLNTTAAVTGSATGSLQASGNTDHLGELNVELNAQGQKVTINGRDAGQLSLTAHTKPGGRVDVDLVTGIAGKPQPLRGSIELQKPGRPIDVEADLSQLDLAPVLAAFAPDLGSSIAGAVSGTLHVTGPILNDKDELTLDGLRGDLTLNTIALKVQDRQVSIQTPFSVIVNGPQVTLAPTRITGEGFDLNLGGTIGLDQGSRLAFTLNGTANLDRLGQVSPDVFLGGTVAVDARLEGTVSDPWLGGEITLTGVSFEGTDLPINIQGGNGRIALAGDRITLENFTARSNDGSVAASGSVTLAQLRPQEWNFTLTADRVDVLYGGAQVTLDANLNLNGTKDRQVLGGTVTIPEGEYTTNFNLQSLAGGGASGGGIGFESTGSGGGSGGAGLLGLPPLNLDVQVEARNSLLIRNQQVNTVGSASLNIAGNIDDPNVSGRVSVEGGTIKLRSQRYDITTGTIDFPAGGGTPEVNVLIEGDVGSYHVYLGLRGPIDAMDITTRSEPDLPRSEVLSLVATGKTDSSSLGSQDIVSSGLGTAASLLSEQFISQPAQSVLGLSRFEIDPVLQPNSNPAARITLGRQITRDLSFTYSTNLGSEQDQSAIVEYTVTNRFSAIASYTQGGTVANGASTDSNFTIEVRARRRFALGYQPETVLAGSAGAPPHVEKPVLPKAEVTVEATAGVKLSSRTLKELLPVETEGFSRPLSRLGERNLSNYLQERGYFFASVKAKCEPADCSGPNLRVVYDVQPGERLDLDQIRIEGTDQLSYGDVRNQLQSKKASFIGGVPVLKNLPLIGGYARGLTSDDRMRQDRETVRARMADLGFRSARVTSRIERVQQSPDMMLIFHVDPGTRAIVAEVGFKGNMVFPSAELRKNVSVKDGDPFSPTKARESVQHIRSHYADQGFLDTTAQYNVVDAAPDQVRLVYNVTEGPRAVVAEIDVTGYTKTREASIRRFLTFKPGDVLTPAVIRRTERVLYASGAFSEVNIRTEAMAGDNPDARRVTVQVTEAKPLLLVYGPGYSTDEGPTGLAQLTDSNLFGKVDSASIRMRVSPREQLAQLTYTDLRPFGRLWALTVSTFYDRNSHLLTQVQPRLVSGGTAPNTGQGFGIARLAAFIQGQRRISETTLVRLRYNFEDTKLSNPLNLPVLELGPNAATVRVGELSAGYTEDTRNSPLNPTRGQLISFEHSFAARPLGGNVAFNKFFANYQHYYTLARETPFLRDTTFVFAGRVGLAAPYAIRGTGPGGSITDADRELPISQRFFSGGATTLRGFNYDAAGPQGILEPRNGQELPTLVALGGDAVVVLNFEARYPLTGQLRLVPFYDLGNVFARVSDISLSGMTHSVGLGFRINTPIGPVGIDYGYLLNPPSFTSAAGIILRQPQGVIHIRFGQSF